MTSDMGESGRISRATRKSCQVIKTNEYNQLMFGTLSPYFFEHPKVIVGYQLCGGLTTAGPADFEGPQESIDYDSIEAAVLDGWELYNE